MPQCKAILLGLDLSLQSGYSQEQQNSQPQSVLAAKASIQIMTSCLASALDNISACPRQNVGTTRNVPAEGGASRQSTDSNASNDSPSPTDNRSAATNTTSSSRNSAKIIGLESGQLLKTSVISLQAIVNGKRALKPVLHRNVTSTPTDTGSINWRPFSTSTDSVSSNDLQTSERVIERFTRLLPAIPRITIRNCDNEAPDTTAGMPEELSSSDTDVSKLDCNSDLSSDRHGSIAFTTSQCGRLQPRHDTSPTGKVYVPYRPWYCTSESRSSVASKLLNVCNEDHTPEVSKTELADQASFETATHILLAELPPLVRCNGVKHESRPFLSKQTETARAVPIIPARSPPRPPTTRNKRKPLVPPPRRRLLRDMNPSLSAEQGIASTPTLRSVSTQPNPTVGFQKRSRAVMEYEPTLLVSLQDVIDRSLTTRQRASTGDLAIGTTHPYSKAKFRRDCLLQRLRHPSPGADVQLIRPASTPEMNASKSKPTIPPAVSELQVREPSHTAGNHTNVQFDDEPCDIRDVLQDMRAVEVIRIRDICESWNGRQWAKAESYLTYHLSTLKTSPNSDRTRRIRHLLGVCASYRGQWQRALSLFISVLCTPVEDVRKLDDGERAAFYWLADTYALLGHPMEALLAYCLAGSCCESASGPGSTGSWRCLLAEQKLFRQTVSDAAFEAVWADESFRTGEAADGQLLHSTIVSQGVAQACLQALSSRSEEDCKIHAQNHSSANQTEPVKQEWYQMRISPLHFDPDQVWPIPHDTIFSTANVIQGRIFPRESDLLNAAQHYPEALLPRQSLSFPMMISKTIPSEGLSHLIPAIHETLQILSMGWSEVISPRDVSFRVAYTAIEDDIATVRYIKLEIVRIPFGIEYALILCSGKTSSSARKTFESSRIGRKITTATTRRAVRTCLRTTLEAVICERRRRAADSSKALPALPPSMDLPVQPLPLPIVPAPAPAPTPTPPTPSPSPSPPPSSKDPTTATTETSHSLCTRLSSSSSSKPDDSPLMPREEELSPSPPRPPSPSKNNISSLRNSW